VVVMVQEIYILGRDLFLLGLMQLECATQLPQLPLAYPFQVCTVFILALRIRILTRRNQTPKGDSPP